MIEFYLGKTGSGKSYLALKTIYRTLLETDDYHVVTNLAIDKGKLNALMRARHPGVEPDVVGRIHFLDDNQCRQFYLYREPGNVLQPVTKEDEKQLKFPDFGEASKKSGIRILYVIDEAHIFFDAREWAQVGPTLNFFASQHRKFRCDVIFVTQFLDQVEKRLRNHSVKFTECINYGVRKLAFWKMPKVFRTLETYKAPPCPSESSGTCRIDLELADCYDTTAGVGVVGGNAKDKERRKGLPFWTLPATALAAAAALWFAPDLAVKGLVGAVEKAPQVEPAPAPAKPAPTAPGVPSASGSQVSGPSPLDSNRLAPSTVQAAPQAPRLRVRSWLVRGNQALITLDDGRVLTEEDPEFGGIARRGNALWVEGQKLYMVPPLAPTPPLAASQIAVNSKETAAKGTPDAVQGSYQGEAVIPTPESAAAVARLGGLSIIPPLQAPSGVSASQAPGRVPSRPSKP